jgi:hypothetical protein
MKLTTHLLLLVTLRMCGESPPPPIFRLCGNVVMDADHLTILNFKLRTPNHSFLSLWSTQMYLLVRSNKFRKCRLQSESHCWHTWQRYQSVCLSVPLGSHQVDRQPTGTALEEQGRTTVTSQPFSSSEGTIQLVLLPVSVSLYKGHNLKKHEDKSNYQKIFDKAFTVCRLCMQFMYKCCNGLPAFKWTSTSPLQCFPFSFCVSIFI